MAEHCPECGSPVPEGGSCRDNFHALLLLEATIPGGPDAVPHFYAVACYGLQHPDGMNNTADALAGLRAGVADLLDGQVTLDGLRRRTRRAVNGVVRITRRAGDAAVPWRRGRWPMTVADVLTVAADRDAYAEQVLRWARSTREALEDSSGVGGEVVRRLLAFIAVGSFFATVEEFLTVVVLRRDVASYLFTLVVLFPVFLTFVWASSRLLNWLARRQATQEVLHFFLYGLLGLVIEWFLIGLTPWSDPNAHPAVMLLFQLGMFSFWATVAFAPRLFLTPGDASRRARRAILTFYLPYFLAVYIVALSIPERWRFVVVIALIVFGYLTLNGFYLAYFVRSFRCYRPEGSPG
jgi:hypothetical protein